MTEQNPGAGNPKQPPAPKAAAFDAAAIANACHAAGFPQLTARLITAQADKAAVDAAVEQARAVTQTAEAAGLPQMAASLIGMGATVEQARDMLAQMRVGAETDIDNTVKPPKVESITAKAYDNLNKRGPGRRG